MGPKNSNTPRPVSRDFQGFQATVAGLGTIVDWVDEKVYGWVKSGDKRYFVHFKDFEQGQRRPKASEEVHFIQGIGPKGPWFR
jgi:cold shock CspA family protein